MSLIDDNSLLHDFRMSMRGLRLSIRAPEYHRGWTAYGRVDKAPAAPRVTDWITRTAHLEKDSVAVIGKASRRTTRFSFALNSFDTWEDLQESWMRPRHQMDEPLYWFAQDAEGEDGAKLLQFLRNVYDWFNQRAPTALIGFLKRDLE